MNAWFKNQDIKKVKPIGDGEGVFTHGLGFLVDKPKQGFGKRSWRYSMLVDDGKIIKQFVEEGQNDSSNDDDPFVVSDAQTMLDFITPIVGKWDGKSRPSNEKYRENFDDIFKKTRVRLAGSQTVRRSSVRARSKGIKKK